MKINVFVLSVILLFSRGLAPELIGQDLPKHVSDGNSLYAICTVGSGKPTDAAYNLGTCWWFVEGVTYTIQMFEVIKLPSDVTHVQLQNVTVKYLKDHPETRKQDAVTLITKAMIAAFPK